MTHRDDYELIEATILHILRESQMKVFLDVGANIGQTLAAVQEKDFDRIYSFEPSKRCWGALEAMADERTTIERFGLWNKTIQAEIIDPGAKSGGMWLKSNRRADLPITKELCDFRRARDWFHENIKVGDHVYLKLNCEGCECDVLDDLLDSGEFEKVTFCLICFDIHKIAGMAYRRDETIVRLMTSYSSPRFMFSTEASVGPTHRERIHHWLNLLPCPI